MKKWLLRTLFFLPAIIATLIVIWVFCVPSFQLFEMPLMLWVLLATFYGSGILLSFNKFYGGIVALIIPVGDYIYFFMSGYGGFRHIDTIPYVLGLILFYIICGLIVYRNNKKSAQ